jgi:hypothetical protein
MSEINPRIVDGEPVCSGSECPECKFYGGTGMGTYVCKETGGVAPVNNYCIPGLRRQRDEAIDAAVRQASDLGRQLGEAKARGDTLERERDEARRSVICYMRTSCSQDNVNRFVQERGWSYLYEAAR